MRLTLAQVDSQLGAVDANIKLAKRVLTDTADDGPDVVVFPELFLSGYSVGEIDHDLSVWPDDPRLRGLAKLANSGLLIGFPELGSHGLHSYNSVAYYEDGQLRHVHRKLYLPTYGSYEERKHFVPGQALRAYPVGAQHRAATLLCNDAWQPQLAFLATQDGARVLFVPAATAASRYPARYSSTEYWRSITRFYGRMFQLFVVFVNRVGTEGNLTFAGGSHVVDPWGEVIAEAAEGTEQLLTVDIDIGEVRRRRRDIPLVKEARLGLLRREIQRLLEEGGDL